MIPHPVRTSLLALVALATPALAPAQDASPPADAAGGTAPVTLQAFQARMEQHMLAADSNGDGRVSLAEYTAANSGRPHAAERFQRMDANGDGYVDKSEIDAAAVERFKRMDRDGDGVLSPDERMAARPQHGRGPDGGV